jgi:hypothetical protein
LRIDRAIQLKPDYLAAFGGRAAAFGRKGLLDRAIADLDVIIKADPKNVAVIYERGKIRAKKRGQGRGRVRLSSSRMPRVRQRFFKAPEMKRNPS